MVVLLLFMIRESFFLVSFAQTIAAMRCHSIAPTLEAGIKKDSGPYTFVQKG
jgi:hypothetical protein